MKKTLILIISTLLATNLFAQYEEGADHIVKDPSNTVSTNAEFSQEINDFYLSDNNISFGTEMLITHNLSSFNIPFHYKNKKLESWTFNAFLPIITKKESLDEKARGIGDLTIGGTYIKQNFIKEGFMANGSFEITLPTGDDEKVVNNVPIPLGTGSFGVTANFSVNGKINKGIFYASINYRLNTYNKTITKYTFVGRTSESTNRTKSPSILSINGNYDYPILDELHISGAALLNYFGSGHYDIETIYSDNTPTYKFDDDLFQSTVILCDISTELEYTFGVNGLETISTFLQSAYLKVKIPVYKSDVVGNRYVAVAFGLRKNI